MVIIHEIRRWEVTESTTINSRSYMKAGSGTEEWYMCLGVVMEAEIERFRVVMIIPELLFFSPSNQGSAGHTLCSGVGRWYRRALAGNSYGI